MKIEKKIISISIDKELNEEMEKSKDRLLT